MALAVQVHYLGTYGKCGTSTDRGTLRYVRSTPRGPPGTVHETHHFSNLHEFYGVKIWGRDKQCGLNKFLNRDPGPLQVVLR